MWTYRWDRAFWRLARREERCGRCMWIEIYCWIDLGRSLESYFPSPGAPRVLVFYPPSVSVNRTCTPVFSQRFLALLSTWYSFSLLARFLWPCRSHVHILNIYPSQPKSVSATG